MSNYYQEDLRFATLTNTTRTFVNVVSMQIFNKGTGGAGSDVILDNKYNEPIPISYGEKYNVPEAERIWSELIVTVPADTTAIVSYYM